MTETPPHILVVAGDPSGDLHGANLVREFKALAPGVQVVAMGGKHLRDVADEFLFDLASLGLTGFIDPVTQFLLIQRLLRVLRRHLDRRPPALVVTIDFYGFNHQVLGLAKHRNVPAYYYISPQVWASRAYRVLKLKRLVKRMLLIFPFEQAIYEKAGVPCTFVGHPLLDLLPEARAPEKRPDGALRIGLLPGSRPSVVNTHLPIYLDALARVRKEFPKAEAFLFASSSISDDMLAPHLERARGTGPVCIVRESDYAERSQLDFAMTTSGTATLENALLGIPMVVAYKTNWPTFLIAKAIALVKHVAMANILVGKELIPELLQAQCTAENVARKALGVLKDPGLDRLRDDLVGLRSVLGGGGASRRAAEILAAAASVPQKDRVS